LDKHEKYDYWLDNAKYDLDSADAMYKSGRWLYVVFMCQQAVEKLVKGLYIIYMDDNVPRTHNIRVITDKIEDFLPEAIPEKYFNLFEELTIYYLNGRYTDYKQKTGERIDERAASDILKRTTEVFAWLLTLKP
jgi:HEPN domain-containing protein